MPFRARVRFLKITMRAGQANMLLLEEIRGFRCPEGEICCADLAEAPSSAEATESQAGVRPGRDHDMTPRR